MNNTYRRHAAAALLSLACASAVHAASPLILNEFNCVSDGILLEADGPAYEGYDYGAIGAATAYAGAGKTGRIQGNGGNWVEFVVTQDRADLRGFRFEWDNADPDAGGVTFGDSPLWANVRAGTIITFIEDGLQTPLFADSSAGEIMNLDTDTGFNPATNDWWINVDIDDARYVQQSGMKVDNDNWRGRILDGAGNVRVDWVGEGVSGWGGTGINSREVAMLNADATATSGNGQFTDIDWSTFGAPNLLEPSGATSFEQLVPQDFSDLRTWWTSRTLGDANVDGKVDFSDLLTLARNYGATSGKTWFEGDFDASGDVSFTDLLALARNYGFGALVEVPGASPQFAADWAAAQSLVPEPATLTVAVGSVLTLARRRRR